MGEVWLRIRKRGGRLRVEKWRCKVEDGKRERERAEGWEKGDVGLRVRKGGGRVEGVKRGGRVESGKRGRYG